MFLKTPHFFILLSWLCDILPMPPDLMNNAVTRKAQPESSKAKDT